MYDTAMFEALDGVALTFAIFGILFYIGYKGYKSNNK